jgi:hypothetical protein
MTTNPINPNAPQDTQQLPQTPADYDFFRPQEPKSDTPQQQTDPSAEDEAEELKRYDELTRKYFGFGAQDLGAMYEYFSSQQREQQLGKLRSEWGDNYDEIYKAVEQRLSTLPPEKQMALNNVEGALLLAKVIAEERKMGVTYNTPQPERSDPKPDPGTTTRFRLSELLQLRKTSPDKYAALSSEIDEAYRLGLVERDV